MTTMTTHGVHPGLSGTQAGAPLRMLWAELTGKCQLSCLHCYAGSGPDGTHGTMTAAAWETVLSDAAALGTRMVCFIGGEPLLYPGLCGLVRHALGLGMRAEVYTNLVHVTPDLWDLFSLPGVSLATSWYTSDREQHKVITGGHDTWRQTRANIAEAARRGIPVRTGVVDGIVPGQQTGEGERELLTIGIASTGRDTVREFGRGTVPDPSQACGNCGQGRAAVLPDGTVTPCPLTRWMGAGNVLATPLADILGAVTQLAETLPARTACGPEMDPCRPDGCRPDNVCPPDARATVPAGTTPDSAAPGCAPDAECRPFCSPYGCKPNL
jgi:MoaA/NifB/PqqE/SkfB family radical SAM enzyme